MNSSAASIAFDPLLPWEALLLFGLVGIAIAAAGLARRATGVLWRIAAVATVLAALANPSLVEEERRGIDDVALIIIDDSDSQSINDRRAQVAAAREALRKRLGTLQGLEVREVVLPPNSLRLGSESLGGTRLINTLRNALVDIPRERLAGIILITDGQVHDVPATIPPELATTPTHVLLSGRKNEADRLVVLEQAPKFGVVGKHVTAKFRVEDSAPNARSPAPVTITVGNEPPLRLNAPIGRTVEVDIPIANGGANVVQLEVAPGTQELTLENNRALFVVNGVRDRLRVLLVSGEPYGGERAWRNLLKGDPAVDLVHFTILRTPSKDDFTPTRELSLIQFPMKELFDLKLREFDLIVFDRYETGSIITREYFTNIANYVRNGGALLLSVGPVYATQRSIYRTPLGGVLPAPPAGDVIERGFKPKPTTLGDRHPVTADLPQAGRPAPLDAPSDVQREEPSWGRWFRLIPARAEKGVTVLAGAEDKPLVVLDRVGEGRVAQILSDHLWLWNRGIEGGGPQAELVRRIAHWLMREPDLEEEALRATAQGGRIEIKRQTLADSFAPVVMTAPNGDSRAITLNRIAPGRAVATIQVDKPGLYKFDDGKLKTVAAVGNPDPLEFSDVRATDKKLKPLAEASGGGMIWLADVPDPEVRRVSANRIAYGDSWIGLRRNESYAVTGVNRYPLLPGLLVALAFLLGIGLAWFREGK
ncbi:MAG TPA: hypothetical protein VJ890_07760 [Vineibacter sp.]|nr:hypothetical protein [Vineibacter sp.]